MEIEELEKLDGTNLEEKIKNLKTVLEISELISEVTKKINKEDGEQKRKLEEIKKELDKQQKSLEKQSNSHEEIKEISQDVLRNLIKQSYEEERQVPLLKKLSESWKTISSGTNSINNSLNNISGLNLSRLFPANLWTENAKNLIDMEDTAYRMSQRAGKGNEGVKELKSIYSDIQVKLKDSAQNAREITKALSERGYVKDLGDAAGYISLFSRTAGVSISQTTDLMNSLTKIGKFTSKEAGTILTNVAKIQKQNGITVDGMNAWANSVKTITNNMKAFGQTDESIKRMAVSTAKLVSSLEKVGVSAQQATEWIVELTDPDRIEKNIGLYAQLGVSISDALSGNIDGDTIGEGLKEFGRKIKEMGPIAGKAYADAFGISYKEAIKAADMEMAIDTGGVTEGDSKSELEKMKEETLSFNQKQQENMNILIGSTQKLMSNMSEKFMMIATSLGTAMSMAANKFFDEMIYGHKKYDDFRRFSEGEFNSLLIADGRKAAEDYLQKSIESYKMIKTAAEALGEDAPKNLKLAAKEADKLIPKLQKMSGMANLDEFTQKTAENFKEEFDNLKKGIEGLEKVTLTGKNFDIDRTNLESLLEQVNEKNKERVQSMLSEYEKAEKEYIKNITMAANDVEGALKDGSDSVQKKLLNSSRKLGREMRSSSRIAANTLRSAGRALGRALTTALGPLALVNILWNAVNKGLKITEKLTEFLKKLGPIGNFIGRLLDLDMDGKREDSLDRNTEAIEKNNETQERKPETLYISGVTGNVEKKNGVKTTSDLVKQETQPESVNKTTNANVNNTNQNQNNMYSERVVHALENQNYYAQFNNKTVAEILNLLKTNNQSTNNVAAKVASPGEVNSNSDFSHNV